VSPRIAITSGDLNGIGPEVALKVLADARMLQRVRPLLIGPLTALREHIRQLDMDGEVRLSAVSSAGESTPRGELAVLDTAPGQRVEVEFGRVTAEAGRHAMLAVERATDLCLSGDVDGMVTAPISKEAISLAGYETPGHTEFLVERTGARAHTMMMVSDRLRVGLVTAHVPLAQVPRLITVDAILEKLRVVDESLRRDFGVERPRIAVLGLNPHAGDGGVLGREERDVIEPAIRQACERGILAFGAYPADGFFGMAAFSRYDAVLAMYHDQGLVPFKALAFETGVNFTAGLSIVRTSPDHGTAFGIAGRGVADASSMRHALFSAIDIVRARAETAAAADVS
jgi:4-hydroxythreonine-4-phosphate dehydrogenase